MAHRVVHTLAKKQHTQEFFALQKTNSPLPWLQGLVILLGNSRRDRRTRLLVSLEAFVKIFHGMETEEKQEKEIGNIQRLSAISLGGL